MNYYPDDDRHRIGPLKLIAGLVAIGAIGGRRGQRLLGVLKKITVWAALLSLPLAILFGLTIPDQKLAAVAVAITLVWGVIALVFWCYVAFAQWLTSEDEEEYEQEDEDDEEATGQ